VDLEATSLEFLDSLSKFSNIKKAGPNDPAFWNEWLEDAYFLNFLLNPTKPTIPENIIL